MKKRLVSGKWSFSGKAAGGQIGVDYWHVGHGDALENRGCRVGTLRLAGHLKKCYMNGYKEGQQQRARSKPGIK